MYSVSSGRGRITLLDRATTEDDEDGHDVRQRQFVFLFDAGRYRESCASGLAWLADERRRAIVALMEGAAHADLFEAQRRNAEHLERAFACAAQAWAIAPKDEAANALYQRLHALTPKRP